jgi:hypothetical protein
MCVVVARYVMYGTPPSSVWSALSGFVGVGLGEGGFFVPTMGMGCSLPYGRGSAVAEAFIFFSHRSGERRGRFVRSFLNMAGGCCSGLTLLGESLDSANRDRGDPTRDRAMRRAFRVVGSNSTDDSRKGQEHEDAKNLGGGVVTHGVRRRFDWLRQGAA